MGLEGKYQFVKEENYAAHFKALLGGHVPPGADKAKLGIDAPLEISINGDNVTVKNGDKTSNYVLNKVTEEKVFGDKTIQVVAKLDGDTLTLERVGKETTNKSVYALSGSDLVLTTSAVGRTDVPDGKKYFKKL